VAPAIQTASAEPAKVENRRVEPRNSIVARKLLVRKHLEMRQALTKTGKSRREQLEILLECP
jgi:hypothetical protein